MARATPHRFLQRDLAPAELANVLPRQRAFLDVRHDAPQICELGRELVVVRRTNRPQPESTDTTLLQPGEDAASVGVLEGQPQPERRELLGLTAHLRAQLGRAERDAVLVQQADARPERRVGLGPTAVREREQGTRVLRPHAEVDRLAPADANLGESTPRRDRPAQSESDPGTQEVSVERGDRPAGRRKRRRGATGGAQRLDGRPMLEERRPQRRVAGERDPARPPLATEGARGRLGLASRRLEVAVHEGRLGEHQPGLRRLERHAAAGELGHGLLGGLARLRDEANGQQQLAAVAQPVGERDALGAPPLL